MKKITPFLWFNNNAEEAVNFYMSIFENSKITSINRYGESGPGPKDSVMTISFQIGDEELIALNGGHMFTFTPAISFVINCETQEEVDHYWEKLSEGGEPQRCGWLNDKFGITWQIIPIEFLELLKEKDPEKSTRLMNAMMQMIKLDINILKKAYYGE